jgi:hypothetical protein
MQLAATDQQQLLQQQRRLSYCLDGLAPQY